MSNDASEKLIDLVKRSDLVTPKKLDAFLERSAQVPGGMPAEQEKVAEMLVADGLLTRWQADKLLAGKHRGFRLGKYKLLGQIGKGGMSHVYLAEHVLMERRVAIKVLPRQRVKDRSYLSRFQLEARAAARLDDVNIVRVFDIDNEGDTHYIVMEYVEGRDLHQTVSQNGPLPFVTAVRYVAQVATGLQHAHEMGLVHRDIKPANIMLNRRGADPDVVKVLDFGLVKEVDSDGQRGMAGTPLYMSPEAIQMPGTVDPRSDLYAVGAVGYFMLTGRVVFEANDMQQLLHMHLEETPAAPSLLRGERLPEELEDALLACLDKNRAKRPQTARELSLRLDKVVAGDGWNVEKADLWWNQHERGTAPKATKKPGAPPTVRGDQAATILHE